MPSGTRAAMIAAAVILPGMALAQTTGTQTTGAQTTGAQQTTETQTPDAPTAGGTQTPGTTTGSAGCAAIVQAAANGTSARIAADNQTIQQPPSVTTLTCLNNFFNGIGLDVVTNLLNPANLLQAVEGKICNAVQSTWNSFLSSARQCGLTLTGLNFGFGGLGGGLSCPRLQFGGGGPAIGSIGIGAGGAGSGRYINGTITALPGYTLPPNQQGSF